jgi:DNA-binding NarL/FixJ family response regulator
MNPASVLVCEDFLPFRQYVVSTLRNWDYVRVICEVCDGQDAVCKADELKPDLILLDVGLPILDGIAAAHQIRKLVPDSKIIFVTQESSLEVVQEAMALGAAGYVQKTKAGIDLEVAVQAVLEGGQFISRGLLVDSPVASRMQQPAPI